MSKTKVKNGKSSSQDYVNLIYSDSDSDTVPDLNLPPLKGKKSKLKTKTRRNPSAQQHVVSVKSVPCSVCLGVKVVVCGLLLGSILALGVMTYWLTQRVTDLKDQINALENKNAASPEDFQALQTKLSAIDKKLNDIRTGDGGLQALNKSIVSMQARIASLEAAQKQQPDIQTTNNQDQSAMTKTVTDLGSEVQSTKEDLKTVKESQKTFSTQLTELSSRVTVLENPDGREGGLHLDTQRLQVQVTQINSTLSQSLASVLAQLNRQQTHIEALDQFMQGLHGMQEQVTSVQQLALNLNQTQHILLEALNTSGADSELTRLQNQGLLLLEQVKSGNLTTADSDLSSPPPSENYFQELLKDHEDFVHFRNEMYQDISSLNASMASVNGSVDGLRKEVGDLYVKFGQTVANITHLTRAVEEVISPVNSHPSGNLTAKLPTPPDTEEKSQQSGTSESSSQS